MRAAILTDLHLGPKASFQGQLRKLSDHAAPFLRNLVDQLLATPQPEGAGGRRATQAALDVFINLGDVLEDESAALDLARYGEFTSELSRLACPVLHVAGNHDRVNLDDQQLVELWRRNGHDSPSLYYSRDVAGIHFCVLATQETKDVDVRLPAEQLEWLEHDLRQTQLASVVCVHHPLSDCDLEGNRWFAAAPHICRVAERKAFRRVIEGSGKVLLVLNGHAHWNHLDIIAGVPYVTQQSPIENVDAGAPGRPASSYGLLEISQARASLRVFGEQPAHYQFHLSAEQSALVQQR